MKRAENEEGSVNPLYAFLYLTDREEGLIVIGNPMDSPNKAGVATLLDGDPDNNFLQRALTFNPGNALHGARSMSLLGRYAYVSCDSGIVASQAGSNRMPAGTSICSASSNRSPVWPLVRGGK